MNYWITTQWPPRIDESPLRPPKGIWIPDDKLYVVEGIAIGDQVFVYEACSGPTLIRKDKNGVSTRVPCHKGRGGIVAFGRVTEMPSEPPIARRQEYVDRPEKWWRYLAPVEIINATNFLPLAKFVTLLGYSPNYNLRGFGDGHSGVKRIEANVFKAILAQFAPDNR